jgi:Pyruvate carboxylase
MVEEHGIAFIGPSPEHLSMMGDKVRAKEMAVELGLPIVPGSEGRSPRMARPSRSPRASAIPC